MKLLLILLSIMTFAVQDKRTVVADGEMPYDMEVTYFCSYQKGQVRAGDSAMISLRHLEGIALEKIEVEMKSNKNAGAGTFWVDINGENVARKNIANLTNEYVTVDLRVNAQDYVNEMNILLVGTENSLYINKYLVYYSMMPPSTVTLMKGEEQIGTLTGNEVVLPNMPQEGEWRFIGWTDEPFYERHEMVDVIASGVYHPQEDVTLWAVYEHRTSWEQLIATELQDGIYLYANIASSMAMHGGIWNDKVEVSTLSLSDTNEQYEVRFDSEGKATIQLVYVYGSEYIGFEDNHLSNTPSKWDVYHDGQKTAFYTLYGEKTYMLFPGKLVNSMTGEFATTLMEVPDIEATPTALIHADGAVERYLTCHPEVGMGIDTPEDGLNEGIQGEWRIPFGNVELVIRNGRKRMRGLMD
jgi:hypothetical protein